MIEKHPFGIFVPPQAKYLLLGSFTTKEAYAESTKVAYDWFYTNGRNKFWPILEAVYNRELKTLDRKQQLFRDLNMALGDIIWQCERIKNSNLDVNLTNIVYAVDQIAEVLATNVIEKIFFSSRFVEGKFRSQFKHLLARYPHLELVTLPSPSPRYASMTLKDKIARYRHLLPSTS